MRDINDMTIAEQSKPLLTSEYLMLRLNEKRDSGRSILHITVLFAICQTLVAAGVFVDALFIQRTYSRELDNQRSIAVLASARQDAVANNEIKLCEALRSAIIHQRQVVTILAEDAAFFRVTPLRSIAVKSISDGINRGDLPACDGFPRSPIPQQ